MKLYQFGASRYLRFASPSHLATLFLFLAFFIAPKLALSDSLYEFKSKTHGDLSIKYVSVEPSANSYQITLNQQHAGQASIFSLESPPRFVVDLPGNYPTVRKDSEITPQTTSPNSPVKSVRIGTHPEKLRIVFDLARSEHLKFSLSGETITIKFTPTSEIESDLPAQSVAGQNESIAAADTNSKLTLLSAKRESVTLDPKQDPLSPTIVAFAYERIQPGNIPMIRLSLNAPPEFSLNKRDENSYDLTISSVTLTDQKLTLPYFPPSDFDGFTFFQASDAENTVKARIGIDPNRYLTAFVRGNDIYIRSLVR